MVVISLREPWRRLRRLRLVSMLCAFLIAGVVSRAAPASADNGAVARAKTAYQQGWKALQAGDAAAALVYYKRSYALVRRSRTLFNIAVAEEQLGMLRAALKHYGEFLETAESRDAKFRADATLKRDQLRDALTGRLLVTSIPAGAEVYVDERSFGRTPVRASLLAGSYAVRLVLDGAQPATRNVVVVAKQRRSVRVSLRLDTKIVLRVAPADAMIERVGVPGVRRGRYTTEVQPGSHRFEITRPGYRSEAVTIRVEAGHVYDRLVRLVRSEAPIGVLVVRTKVAGASVSADGLVLGLTAPSTGGLSELRRSLPVGQHAVIVERKGRASWRRKLHISPGEIVSVTTRLGRDSDHEWLRLGLEVGGVSALAIGAVTGTLAIRDVSDMDGARHTRGKQRALATDLFMAAGVAALIGAWRVGRRTPSQTTIERTHAQEHLP